MTATSSTSLAIKQELARRRMSRAALASAAMISLSALEKGLSGQRKFTDAVRARIEKVLGIDLRRDDDASAPDDLGGYARPAVKWLEGSYLTIRPSSKNPKEILTYLTEISWDDTRHVLAFKEMARLDKAYAQAGVISVPHQTGHIYFVTNTRGQHRMAMMKRHSMTGEMFGLLLTLQEERGATLVPISIPLVMMPVKMNEQRFVLGKIVEENKDYESYRAKLARVLDEGFARVLA
jgi:transcriptional regulator with XRE-family HTH domain